MTLAKALHQLSRYTGKQFENTVGKKKGELYDASEGKCRCVSLCLVHVIPERLYSLLSSWSYCQQCRSAAGSLQEPSTHRLLRSCHTTSFCHCFSPPLARSHYRPPRPSAFLLARRIACLLLKPISTLGFLEGRILLLPRAVLLSWM